MNLIAQETIGPRRKDIIHYDEYNIPAAKDAVSKAFRTILTALHRKKDTTASITMPFPGITIHVFIRASSWY